MERNPIVLHANDTFLVSELAGTTEVELPSGRIVFHPPVKNTDHMTDSLLCALSAILSLYAEDSGYARFDFEKEFGFFNPDEYTDYN